MTEIFKKLDFNEFKLRYKADIRVGVSWDKLGKVKTGIIGIRTPGELYIPAYNKGDWRTGKPKKVTLGWNLAVLRLPAVKVGNEFLLLDGTHRVTEIKPCLVIVDYLILTPKQAPYFYDLLNTTWRKYWDADQRAK